MRARVLVALAIMLSGTIGAWAASGYLYVGATDGGFYRISLDDYNSVVVDTNNGTISCMTVLPDQKVAFGTTGATNEGTVAVLNGGATTWNTVSSGGWSGADENINGITYTPAGDIVFTRSDGFIFRLHSDLTHATTYYGNPGVGPLAGVTTLTSGEIAYCGPWMGAILVGSSTTPWTVVRSSFNNVLPGFTAPSTIAALTNGNLVFGREDSTSVCVKGNSGGPGTMPLLYAAWWQAGSGNRYWTYVVGLSDGKIAYGIRDTGAVWVANSDLTSPIYVVGLGTISAMTALPGGKFAVANEAGGLYILNSDLTFAKVYTDYNFGPVSAMAGGAEPAPECGDPAHVYPVGDLTFNCVVDFNDVNILATNWLSTDVLPADGDLSGDTTVNFTDMAMLAANWLVDNRPL